MRKYVNKSLKKFYITSLKEQLLLKVPYRRRACSSLRSVVNATQEHHKPGAPRLCRKLGAPDLRSMVKEVHLVLTNLAQVHDLMKL